MKLGSLLSKKSQWNPRSSGRPILVAIPANSARSGWVSTAASGRSLCSSAADGHAGAGRLSIAAQRELGSGHKPRLEMGVVFVILMVDDEPPTSNLEVRTWRRGAV